MKQSGIFLPILFIVALPVILASCCYSDANHTNPYGLECHMSNSNYYLLKVEFIGKNKVMPFTGNTLIMLNPKDSVCTIRIYYKSKDWEPAPTYSDTIAISYTGTPEFLNDGCEHNELRMNCKVTVTATSFTFAQILTYNGSNFLYLTE